MRNLVAVLVGAVLTVAVGAMAALLPNALIVLFVLAALGVFSWALGLFVLDALGFEGWNE